MHVRRLVLTNFRSYRHLSLDVDADPVVLTGENGAGKTNLLEAVSLLAPGQGLRRASFAELAHAGGEQWAVAADVATPTGPHTIGTGQQPGGAPASGRLVRIDGASAGGSGVLADHVEMVWLTPQMDGLLSGPASERRRFLDRLILCFDPSYRTVANQFDRAMRQRNRLLEDGAREPARFTGLERILAETGVAIAAARVEAVAAMAAIIGLRRDRAPDSLFPWSELALEGGLEIALRDRPAIEVEDEYAARLGQMRERDRAARRMLDGPHRTDLVVMHGPKRQPARLCSTGEQKALLLGLLLAHSELIRQRRGGAPPILLLDEIAAHLDVDRRAALFAEILRLGSQAWLSGTDVQTFSALRGRAQFLLVAGGTARRS
jgi:DNA replication and repair protein RecF